MVDKIIWIKSHVLLLLMVLVMVSSAIACKQSYDIDERIIIIDSIESSGENATCTISIYDDTSLLVTENMTMNGLVYTYNGSSMSEGVYISDIYCLQNSSVYQSECKFEVEGTKMLWIIALAVSLSLAIFTLGLYKEDEHMIAFASMLGMAIGVFILINGIDTIDNLVTLAIGVVIVGLSGYSFIRVYAERIMVSYDELD